ncbi:hypothetical protein JG677_03040 [Campylobacter sp. TTU-622]|uniref:hypothetical protein n=1 Tax=Campylobacter sp. TTU-622 TaxID=2800583 RepID=UPI001905305F|nr:hypothetical protein [Campylobacter sp. TTU-622]MBK1973028.1 hypothetical protein [Campylobacter sp. TTU-622]
MQYKKKFNTTNKSFKIAYCYIVEAFCQDYCSEHLRLGVFTSFDEALSFIAKSFYKSTKNNISYIRENDNTWLITTSNDEIKNQTVRNRISNDCLREEEIDAREIRIRVDSDNFILLDDGRLAQIGEPFFNDEIIFLKK